MTAKVERGRGLRAPLPGCARCGRCFGPLTDVRSRAAGYGKACAVHAGWPYPTRGEARAILGLSR